MKRLVPLLVILLASSACKIRVELDTTIEADGSGTVAFAIGFDEEFRRTIELFSQIGDEIGDAFGDEGGGASDDFFEDIEDDTPEGWSSERFRDGEIEGVRISRDFSDLDDLRGAFEEARVFSDADDELGTDAPAPALSDEVSIEREGDVITIEMAAPETGTPTTIAGGDFFRGQDPREEFEFELVVRFTLPGAIQDHNADEVDGNTLVWRFDQDSEPTPIRATADASASGDGSDFPIALAVALVVLVAGGAGLFFWNRNRRTGAVEDVSPPPPPA